MSLSFTYRSSSSSALPVSGGPGSVNNTPPIDPEEYRRNVERSIGNIRPTGTAQRFEKLPEMPASVAGTGKPFLKHDPIDPLSKKRIPPPGTAVKTMSKLTGKNYEARALGIEIHEPEPELTPTPAPDIQVETEVEAEVPQTPEHKTALVPKKAGARVKKEVTKAPKPPKVPRPRKLTVRELPLEDLYLKADEKVTPTIFKCVIEKEDFTAIRAETYCAKVCNMPCEMKSPHKATVNHEHVNILIIQETYALDEKYKSADRVESLHLRQISAMIRSELSGLTYRVHNMVKCRPARIFKNGKLVKLRYTQKNRCAPYLLEEIRQVNPDVIVSLSTDVSKVLGIMRSNYNDRGDIHYTGFEVNGRKIPVVLTLHPQVLNMIRQTASGKMYGPDFFGVIRNDLKKATDVAKGVYIPVPREALWDHVREVANRQITVCRSIDEVKYWMDVIWDLPDGHVLSWDIEATSLDPWSSDARILTSHFGYRTDEGFIHAVVVPMWHRDNTFYDPDDAWALMAPILESPRKRKTGHNIKFDIVFAEVTTGIDVANAGLDTMLLMHSINSGIQGNYSLKTAVSDWWPESGLSGYEELLGIPDMTDEEDADDDTDTDEESNND